MAVKEIIKDYDVLSQRAKEIAVAANAEEIEQVVGDLKDTIRENNLTHLTAPQIGYNKRVFCINFEGDIRAFINPMIINMTDGIVLSQERCASLEHEYKIPRHKEIAAIYQTPTGTTESNKFVEPVSCIFQQCQDLIDGVLLSDYGLEITPEFEQASESEKFDVLAYYLQHLNEMLDKLNDEIEHNENLKKTRDAIDFMDSVAKGETKLEPTQDLTPIKLNRATRRLIQRKTKKKVVH